ncbi:hypothetical protein JOB18_047105 [Solea senegalensis]|uniref:Uncharacterized protein n=1 Tax=Solea senegalensis TaxID=28829 RepID=A0AAV6QB20_SOLSE|nr:hypothetical protein JOB18_047105 [Solea senegalensis]
MVLRAEQQLAGVDHTLPAAAERSLRDVRGGCWSGSLLELKMGRRLRGPERAEL